MYLKCLFYIAWLSIFQFMYLYGMRDMKSMLSKIMDALATNMIWNEYSLKGRGKKESLLDTKPLVCKVMKRK